MTIASPQEAYSAVLNNPECNLTRLKYADYIEEELGQEDLAKFIRVQIELENTGYAHYLRNTKWRREDCTSAEIKEAIKLHDEEMKLLWADGENGWANWKNWMWAEARNEEGYPRIKKDNLFSGYTVTPHGSAGLGEGCCSVGMEFSGVTKFIYQYWESGFISKLKGRLENLLLCTPIIKNYPICCVDVDDLRPHVSEELGICLFIAEYDGNSSPVPEFARNTIPRFIVPYLKFYKDILPIERRVRYASVNTATLDVNNAVLLYLRDKVNEKITTS